MRNRLTPKRPRLRQSLCLLNSLATFSEFNTLGLGLAAIRQKGASTGKIDCQRGVLHVVGKMLSILAAGGLLTGGVAASHQAPKSVAGPLMRVHSSMNLMQTVASDLHVSTSTLRADRKAGLSLAAIGNKQGISTASLEATLLKQAQNAVQQAVSQGALTSARASTIESHLPKMIDHVVTMTPTSQHSWPGHGRHWGPMKGRSWFAMNPQTLAQDLHISVSTLKADRKAGDSLATIAQKSGITSSALESTLLGQAQSQLQNAESSGRVTSTEAAKIQSHLSTMIDHMVTMTPHQGGWRNQ